MKRWVAAGTVFLMCPVIKASVFKTDLKIVYGDIGSGQIFVACDLNGNLRNCFLDTGSNLTFVASDERTKLFPRLGEVTKTGASGSTLIGVRILVPSFKIGDAELGPREIGRFDRVRHDQVGMDIFKDEMLTLDLCNLNFIAEYTNNILPMSFKRLSKGHISLPITIGKSSDLHAVFDTGAGLNSVDTRFVLENPSLFKFKQDLEGGYDINGNKVVLKLYQTEGFVVGTTQFGKQDFLSFDFGSLREYLGRDTPLIIGFNAIDKHQWTFDLKNLRFEVRDNLCNKKDE